MNNFNKTSAVKENEFASTTIDYLIAPHHGSEHTGYRLITDGTTPIKGKDAIICCTNEENRPNAAHMTELKKRFTVKTTESERTIVMLSFL